MSSLAPHSAGWLCAPLSAAWPIAMDAVERQRSASGRNGRCQGSESVSPASEGHSLKRSRTAGTSAAIFFTQQGKDTLQELMTDPLLACERWAPCCKLFSRARRKPIHLPGESRARATGGQGPAKPHGVQACDEPASFQLPEIAEEPGGSSQHPAV